MRLNFNRHGQGHPLIVMHGLFGSLDNLASHNRNLAEHFTVYAVDLRNHGHSPHKDTMDYPAMAQDVLAFMAREGIDCAHLMGHSMGGKVAMQVALNHEDRVGRLIVVDIAPKAYPPHHDRVLNALLALDVHALESRQQIDKQLKQAIPDNALRLFLSKNLRRRTEGGYYWRINLPVIRACYNRLRAAPTASEPFSGSTLFIKGSKSDYISSADWAHIADLFPQAQLKTIEDAGHWPHAEKPAAFAETILEFLGSANG